MSIASELNRLLQAKSDLATSIAAKGVTVPAATTLDGYAALVDSIQTSGGGTDIFSEMSNYMYVVSPYQNPFNTPYALLYNLIPGKSYKIIAKVKKAHSGSLAFYAYKGNANSPAVSLGLVLSSSEMIKEVVYTHTLSTTYTRIGIWASNSAERTNEASCAVYIKEIE